MQLHFLCLLFLNILLNTQAVEVSENETSDEVELKDNAENVCIDQEVQNKILNITYIQSIVSNDFSCFTVTNSLSWLLKTRQKTGFWHQKDPCSLKVLLIVEWVMTKIDIWDIWSVIIWDQSHFLDFFSQLISFKYWHNLEEISLENDVQNQKNNDSWYCTVRGKKFGHEKIVPWTGLEPGTSHLLQQKNTPKACLVI